MSALSTFAEGFPERIPLPFIDRPCTQGNGSLTDIRCAEDLPGRMLAGDLVPGSFRRAADGWSAQYRDDAGSRLDLQVTGGRFEASLCFFGQTIFCAGPAQWKPFMLILSSEKKGWDALLRRHLEARYPVVCAEADYRTPSAFYRPDGWLYTFFVPVGVHRLEDLLAWHRELADQGVPAAPLAGCIRLHTSIIYYITGPAPAECSTPDQLTERHFRTCGTPLLGKAVQHTTGNGNHVWAVQRLAYLYRCTCFLRDVPEIAERLFQAGFLQYEPDLQAAVVPAESGIQARELSWWSAERDCRIIWTGFDGLLLACDIDERITGEQAAGIVKSAVEARKKYGRRQAG